MKSLGLFLLVVLFLIPTFTRSDEMLFDVGLGALDTSSSMKFLSFGIQEDLWDCLKMRGNGGGWIDNSAGASSSGFFSGQLGFEVDSGSLTGDAFFGPGMVTQTDSVLGGPFQFESSLELTFHDINRNGIGVFFRHFSSAGFEMPNQGRDVLGLELKFPF